MYLKVYYNAQGKDASIPEVKEALPANVQGLTIDEGLGYPCVNFPQNAGIPELKQVKEALQKAGFETE